MFGIDFRPILSQVLGTDLSGVPVELVLPIAAVVLLMQGVKAIDDNAFSGGLKPFYGHITLGLSLILGVAFSVFALGHGLPGVIGDAVLVYMSAVAAWAFWEANHKAFKAIKAG